MARLIHCDDTKAGITRERVRGAWAYFDPDGARITDRDEIDRLNAIGLPPAYRDAWFCPNANGHLQAVGWDEKGRKQYRYHPEYRAQQDAEKYERCAAFGETLPALRKRVTADLRKRSMSKDRAVAAVVRLLDETHIRVGNEGYTKANRSYGATTLRKRHARTSGNKLQLCYTGKSGKSRTLTITDRTLKRFVRKCQDLPGQHLFAWMDKHEAEHPVTSNDVNDYIRDATGSDFTAKHFRTWAASVTAFDALAGADHDLTLKAMLIPVTERLGNTPAVARKSYVHPALIALVKKGQGSFRASLKLPRAARGLSRAERGLIAFLQEAA